MVALDTNLMVYAHREDSVWHQPAREILEKLVFSGARWAIPWPCLHEFYSVVTHPKIFGQPTPPALAWEAFRGFTEMAQVRLLAETEDYADRLARLVGDLDLRGPRIHDARIAVLCHVHGIRELWSSDRDFSRFGFLKVKNPLVT